MTATDRAPALDAATLAEGRRLLDNAAHDNERMERLDEWIGWVSVLGHYLLAEAEAAPALRAELAEARDALARVEALATTWERDEAYSCRSASECTRCVTYQGVVIRLSAALRRQQRQGGGS